MTKQKKASSKKNALRGVPSYLWLMPLCIAVYGLLYLNFGEIIAVNQGCGWDGCWFRDVAAYGPQQFTNKQFTPYRAQRWLPSIIVHYTSYYALLTMQRFGMEMPETATAAIVATFRVYNLLLLMGAAWLWGLISRHLLLKTLIAWTGFSLVFGSFAVMKYSFYYPPLTDTSAFFIGILMLFSYLLKREWLLLGAIVLGFWTWQTTFFVGMLLYLFPESMRNSLSAKSTTEANEAFAAMPLRLRLALTAFYALLLAAGIVLAAGWYTINFDAVEKPFVPLVYVCGVLTVLYGAYTAFFCSSLLSPVSVLALLRDRTQYRRWGIAFAVAITLYVLKSIVQNPELRSEMPLSLFLGGTLSAAVSKPLLALVANTVFYGVPLLLTILLLPRLVQHVRSLGLGFVLVFTLTLLLTGIMTESRQLVNLMPFLVVPCCLALNTLRVGTNAFAGGGIIAIMLLWSQAWVHINFEEMHDLAIRANVTAPSMQAYFRFHGPWMAMEAYIWTAAATMVTCGFLFLLLRPLLKFSRADF
jgi:hypothetical protein